jgi:AraC-like DNA-binding protein
MLEDPNGRLPVELLERLVCAGADMTGDEQLGLHLSQVASAAGFGVLGYIRQVCSTLQEVIDMTMRYERLVSDIGTTSLQHRPGVALWCWDCKTRDPVFRRQATEYMLGCWINIQLRLVSRQTPPMLAVHFRHAPPVSAAALDEYRRAFGCPVLFGQPESGLVLATAVLSLPLIHADVALQETLEQHARQLLEQRQQGASVIDPVRAQLRLLLHRGIASRERLAEHLGVSSRHLHRQLEKAGSSYRQLLDELRLELAQGLLQDQGLTVEAIAQRLHFAEGQSFIRWFRTMMAMTPAEFRRRQAPGGGTDLPGNANL